MLGAAHPEAIVLHGPTSGGNSSLAKESILHTSEHTTSKSILPQAGPRKAQQPFARSWRRGV